MIDKTVKYLDPKNDLTFRKIFGQHEDIMMSFLNSILPFKKGQYIKSLVYEDPALIPELPELKHSIVDVRCTDNFDRQFIVEMQMYWTNSFKNRMLFNSGKAYVKQIDKGHKYSELKPVYGLSLIDDTFLEGKEYEKKYYHHFRMAHREFPNEIIEGIELIFIELPKFKAQNFTEKKLRYLWLRFLTEIDENTEKVPQDLLDEAEIKKALDNLQISAFSKKELAYYEKYWDNVRVEKAALEDALEKIEQAEKKIIKIQQKVEQEQQKAVLAQQKAEQEQQKAELAQQKAELAQQKAKKNQQKLALKMLKYGEDIEEIAKETGLSSEEIEELKK